MDTEKEIKAARVEMMEVYGDGKGAPSTSGTREEAEQVVSLFKFIIVIGTGGAYGVFLALWSACSLPPSEVIPRAAH
jgi:hypothetical protein